MCFVVFSTNAQVQYLAKNTDANERTNVSVTPNQVYFSFPSMDQSTYLTQIDNKEAGKHFLGEFVAKKQFLFSNRYSYKEPIAPGSSATKIIYRKPDIYFSVKKIEKHIKKELANNKISNEEAIKIYNKVLNVALNVLDEDTQSLERRINSVNRNPSELLKVFVNEVELN
jgi:hypothetical protein